MRTFISALIIILFTTGARSQQFGIHSFLTIKSPCPLELYDWFDKDILSISLLLNDPTEEEQVVNLKLSIKGLGNQYEQQLRSHNPITLYQYETFTLDYYTIKDLLDLSSINSQNSKLPEGFYQITVQAFDANRMEVPVSNMASASIWLFLGDPPLIISPSNLETIKTTNPQQINIQWIPQHQGIISSEQLTKYKITIHEYINHNIAPEEIIKQLPAYFEGESHSPIFLYDNSQALLKLGEQYILQIQVTDDTEMSLYKNEGYSEPIIFTFGQSCHTPSTIEIESNSNNLKLSWSNIEHATQYKIAYRHNEQWYQDLSFNHQHSIYKLKPSTEYQIKIKSLCGNNESEFSKIINARTSNLSTKQFSCSQSNSPRIQNQEQKKSLENGNTFYAHDFMIVVKSSNNTSPFSGEGIAQIPYLKYAYIPVEFNNLRLNTEDEMLDGIIYTHSKLDDKNVKPSQDNSILEDEKIADSTGNTNLIAAETITINTQKTSLEDTTSSNERIDINPPMGADKKESSDKTSSSTQYASGSATNSTLSQTNLKDGVQGEEGSISIGPIKINFDKSSLKKGELAGGKRMKNEAGWSHFESLSGTLHTAIDSKTYKSELHLDKAKIKLDYHKENNQYRNVSITWAGDQDINDILPNPCTLVLASISLEDGETLTGELTFKVKEGTVITAIENSPSIETSFSGQLNFHYQEGIKGTFETDSLQINSLKLFIQNQEFAQATEISLDENLILNATFKNTEAVSFHQKTGDITYKSFAISTTYNHATHSFSIRSGGGKISITNLPQLQGELQGIFTINNNSMTVALDDDSSSLHLNGIEIIHPSFKILANTSFEITELEGKAKVKHKDFSDYINCNKLHIKDGILRSLEITGKTSIKGFHFELTECKLRNDSLIISAQALLAVSDIKTWLAVDKFSIIADGKISIGRIEGRFKKSPIHIGFQAAFKDDGFQGTFNTQLATFGLSGELDIGSKESFNYSYLRLRSQTNIPLPATGLKISELGGSLGFNYHLEYKKEEANPVGYAIKGKYLIGLSLGVGDMAGMFNLSGRGIAQWGDDELELNLEGKLAIPKSNPNLIATLNVNYQLPSNAIYGTAKLDAKIPARTGAILMIDKAHIGFNVDKDISYLEGDNINAQLFKVCHYEGGFRYQKSSKSNIIQYSLNGRAWFEYTQEYKFDFTATHILAFLEFRLAALINAKMDETGFQGELSVELYANATLSAATIIGEYYGSATGYCMASLAQQNNISRLKGLMLLSIQSSIYNGSKSISINKTLNKR